MANIELRLSTGSATNKSVANIKDSIGGKMAESGSISHVITENSFKLNDIWDDISQADNASNASDYRCLYIYNNPTGPNKGPFLGTKIYIGGVTYAKFTLAKVDAKNTDANIAASETTPPDGISFEKYTKENPLRLDTLDAGDRYAIWVKRTAENVSGAGEIREAFELNIVGSD